MDKKERIILALITFITVYAVFNLGVYMNSTENNKALEEQALEIEVNNFVDEVVAEIEREDERMSEANSLSWSELAYDGCMLNYGTVDCLIYWDLTIKDASYCDYLYHIMDTYEQGVIMARENNLVCQWEVETEYEDTYFNINYR